MTMKISSHTVGSWFPTGFYGHHRMKNRADFINEYRQLAKPQPPEAFIHRSSLPVDCHVFSRHDNRHLFQRDVTCFGQGIGRKKHPTRSETSKSNMTWTSCRGNPSTRHPLTSSYRQDFKMEEPQVQMLVKRPVTSFDGVPTTVYRTVHGTDSPNCHLINAMSNEALMLSVQSRQQQAIVRQKPHQESVASCLSWYKPRLPPVTSDPDFNHIDIQPTQESGMKTRNCLGASDTPAVCGNAVMCMTESSHPVENVSE